MRTAEIAATVPFVFGSWSLALITAYPTVEMIPVLALLSVVLLALGILSMIWKEERMFIATLGVQMIWSLIALGLTGASAVVLWALLFGHMAIILAGTRGMWLRANGLLTGPDSARTYRMSLRNLTVAYEWLGASAALSFIFVLMAPLLRFSGGGFFLVALLSILAIVCFTLLARGSLGHKN